MPLSLLPAHHLSCHPTHLHFSSFFPSTLPVPVYTSPSTSTPSTSFPALLPPSVSPTLLLCTLFPPPVPPKHGTFCASPMHATLPFHCTTFHICYLPCTTLHPFQDVFTTPSPLATKFGCAHITPTSAQTIITGIAAETAGERMFIFSKLSHPFYARISLSLGGPLCTA